VQRGAQMRVGREWIDGRGDLPDLLHNRARHARGGELGGLAAGFLSTIDAAVRGDRAANVPDSAKAQLLLEATPSAEAMPQPPIDVDEFQWRSTSAPRGSSNCSGTTQRRRSSPGPATVSVMNRTRGATRPAPMP
jgi:hypothetical protein